MKTACPRCGANVSFMPGTQKLYCEYCHSKIEVNEFEKKEVLQESQSNYEQYTCSTCGAKLITDETTVITDCVYCGSRQIMKEKFKEEFNPKEIIPFKIDRNEFISIYTKHMKKRLLAPSDFLKKERLMETKGVYVPYDLFVHDVDVIAKGNASCIVEGKYGPYTHNKYFEREFSMKSLITVDASKRLNDNIMSSIEPFDFSKLEKFNPAFLNGFLVEAPNESKEKLEEKAEEKLINETIKIIDDTIKKDGMLGTEFEYHFKHGIIHANLNKIESKTVLLPIWFINTIYKNKIYTYLVNGQTGEVVGDIPISKLKVAFVTVSAVLLPILSYYLIMFSAQPSAIMSKFIPIDSLMVTGCFVMLFMFVLVMVMIFSSLASNMVKRKLKEEKLKYNDITNSREKNIKFWNFKMKKTKEALKNYRQTIKLDYISNIKKSIYRKGKLYRTINK